MYIELNSSHLYIIIPNEELYFYCQKKRENSGKWLPIVKLWKTVVYCHLRNKAISQNVDCRKSE